MASHDPSDDSVTSARAATLSALIVVAAFVASKAGRDAIVLSNFRVTLLPYFIGGSALLSFPVILITGKLLARYGPGRLIPVANVVSAALAIAEWWLLDRFPRPIALAVFFHLSISGAILVSGFWSIVGERFDVQTAKRYIARIGMGATLGGIFGGVIAERTAVYTAPDTILLVVAGLQLISAIALSLLRGPPRRDPAKRAPSGMRSALGVITKNGLLRNLAAVVILGALAAGVLDYVFKADIVAGSSKAGLLRSLAIFYTVTNTLTAVVQLALGGAVIAWLGVPRSAALLPATVTAFGAFSLVVPSVLAAIVARGAEVVVRNSIYRGAYELLYAPLPADHKRRTKVVLDVGAERLGDILGAQLVAVIVAGYAAPRTALMIAAVAAGAAALAFAWRLRASYATALEQSLLAQTPDAIATDPEPAYDSDTWIRWRDEHRFGQNKNAPTVSLLRTPADPVVPSPLPEPAPAPVAGPVPDPRVRAGTGDVVAAIATLRSGDVAAIHAVLAAPLAIEVAPHVLDLIAGDTAAAAIAALTTLAPRITGTLVDALLDESRDLAMRSRLPALIAAGDPEHAAWGLWRGLANPSFEIRYRCGVMLARLASSGGIEHITADQVYAAVTRELAVDRETWTSYRLLVDDLAAAIVHGDDQATAYPEGTGLDHVFTLLGLILPPEPLRIALHAVRTDDSELRGTALEYLENVLPSEVRAQLSPLIAEEPDRLVERARMNDLDAAAAVPAAVPAAEPRPKRTLDELIAELRLRSNKRASDRLPVPGTDAVRPRAASHD